MNRILLLVICIVSTCLGSCQKGFFDQVPNDRMTIDEVFQRRLPSEQYLANIYNYLKDETGQTLANDVPWMGLSDEGDVTYTTHNIYPMNLGNWNASSNFFNFWDHYYSGIRSATYFIQRIDENTELQASESGRQLITQYKAEARALRAEFYAALLKQYGPAIILPEDKVIEPDSEASVFRLPRNTYDECVEFIVNQFDMAISSLPDWYSAPNDYGRMTKAACKAYKARTLLYAASPLWNGNTEMSSLINKDGVQLVNQVFIKDKWKRAADAAKEVINLTRFSLYKEFNVNGSINPLLSYHNALLEPWNSEIIFARKDPDLKRWEWRSSPRFAGGTAGNGATQQLVDAYQMANGEIPITGYNADGSPIINPQSGYVEKGFSTQATSYAEVGTSNMYVNREPRFYATIAYNGGRWVNTTNFPQQIGLFFTGNTGKSGGGNNFTRTGYLIRKNIHPKSNVTLTNGHINRPVVLLRLAEVYLSYAEALNEYDPGNPDIIRYVNLIRERAGIPNISSTLSQEALRDRIWLERRTELAFERHRYFDTRRWKIAVGTDGGKFYGMNIDKGANVKDPLFFERTVFETRIFESPKHYLFPIPISEIDRNPSLVQNIGW